MRRQLQARESTASRTCTETPHDLPNLRPSGDASSAPPAPRTWIPTDASAGDPARPAPSQSPEMSE